MILKKANGQAWNHFTSIYLSRNSFRKYNSCWAIAIKVENRFTLNVVIYQGVLGVKQENIKRIDSQQTGDEIRQIH